MSQAEARVLRQLLRGMPGGGDHASRLEAFYGPQADAYDDFRERLLPGRDELMAWLAPVAGERVVELGAGTGRNPAFLGARVRELGRLTLDFHGRQLRIEGEPGCLRDAGEVKRLLDRAGPSI